MGLIYVSSESSLLITALKENISTGKEASEQLKTGSQQVIDAVDGQTLSGEAYTAGKGLFSELILPTISKVTTAIDDVEKDVQTYSNAHDKVSSESKLDEDKLNQQIAIKETMKATVDASALVTKQSIKTNPVANLLDHLFNVQNKLTNMSNELEDDMKELKDKLEKLQTFSSETSSLFTNSLSDMKIAMQACLVLDNTIVNSDGTYELPAGTDKSWFDSMKANNQTEVKQQIAMAQGMSGLNLTEEAKEYYKKIMQEALKNVPIDQWAEAIAGLNELMIFDGEGNILKIDIVDSSSELYISVEKNGEYDSKLTSKAYNEYNAQRWEAVSQNALELVTGVVTFFAGLGITGLDLTGTYFSGGTLAATGITQAGLAVGGSTALAGAGAVADSISKIRAASSGVSFSFTNNYNQQVNNSQASNNVTNVEWTGNDFSNIGKKCTPENLIDQLESQGWSKNIEAGGGKSGPATILKNTSTGEIVRVHTSPSNGKPYFRVQNSGGNYLDNTGNFPSNASRQELRDLTHFYFE